MTATFDKTIRADDGLTDARNPDIKPFLAHNGKLLLYRGWSDQLVPTETTISYYEDVAKKMGGVSKIDKQVRMFLEPGMSHCGGGDGPNTFDTLTALEDWVERGKAPEQMIASHSTAGKVDRTRPLCAYPKTARYTGSGSMMPRTSFVSDTSLIDPAGERNGPSITFWYGSRTTNDCSIPPIPIAF